MVIFVILLTGTEQETHWMGASNDVIDLVPLQGKKESVMNVLIYLSSSSWWMKKKPYDCLCCCVTRQLGWKLSSCSCSNRFRKATGAFKASQVCPLYSIPTTLINRDVFKNKRTCRRNCFTKIVLTKITYRLLTFFWAALPAPLCRKISEAKPHGRRQNHCSVCKLISYISKKKKEKTRVNWR